MQIKIDIEVKPEELRRFLGLPGLPDMAGLQEELVAFLREKVGSAGDFDPAAFVKGNFETLRKSQAWQRLLSAAKARAESDHDSTAEDAAPVKPGSSRASSNNPEAGSFSAKRSRKKTRAPATGRD